MEERASMLMSCRLIPFAAFVALITIPQALTATNPQHIVVGPRAAAAATPVEVAKTPAPLVDRRAQNAEQLRVAQRKVAANGTTDKTATQEVAYYQRREAVL